MARTPLAASLAAAAWLLAAPPSHAQDAALLRPQACTFAGMVDDLRDALTDGSPALRRYARERLKEASLALPLEVLQQAVQQERDPEVLEALGAALAARGSRTEDPTVLQPLLGRAARDGDPALRAAALRGLRGTPSVEAMARNDNVVTYAELIRDPSPEVRQAVVDNLVQESARVYFGHDRTVSEAAVEAALASPDPEAAAGLLRQVSMEQVGPAAVDRITSQLRADSPALRAAAAVAMGGVPGESSARARAALVAGYREERDPAVRRAMLEAIARLGMGGAVSTLQSLRGVDPALAPEVDLWTRALGRGLQEWHLVQREKERLAQQRSQR